MEDSSSSSQHGRRRHEREHDSKNHSKKRRHGDDDDTRRSHKSHKKHRHSTGDADSKHHRSSTRKHHSRRKADDESGLNVVDDDEEEEVWVEKDIAEDGDRVLATGIPTSESLKLTSNATEFAENPPPLPQSLRTESKPKRDDWMLEPTAPVINNPTSQSSPRPLVVLPDEEMSLTEEYGNPEQDKRTFGGGVDFFGSLGTEHKKKRPSKPDPDKPMVSSKELNTQLIEGKSLSEYAAPSAPMKAAFGGPGSQWRMRKLQRVYEMAEEEERPVEEVARERYDSIEDFEEAKAERRFLDDREARRAGEAGGPGGGRAPLPAGRSMDAGPSSTVGSGGEKRWMFTDIGNPESRPSSRNSFRRPGASSDSAPSTPQPGPGTPGASVPANKRVDALRGGLTSGRQPTFTGTPTGASSPLPSALTPTSLLARKGGKGSSNDEGRKRALSPSSLNRLQARVLKAKLMGAPDAGELETQFDEERKRAQEATAGGTGSGDEGAGAREKVEMVPTVDAQGRLYDVGYGKNGQDEELKPGNRRKKEKYVETRDRKTGEVIRVNADDDTVTLGDMLRHERSGAGMADQRNLDAELARAITTDGKFEDDLEYMDDNAERLGRKKMRTDAMKRQFAINDFAKSQKIMAACQYCYGENDEPPRAPVIAMGTRVYLSCTLNEELVDGHCHIAPIQHHLCMLEADDDVWDEVRNFMKCLIRMAADAGKGVIFYETVINLKKQRHTYIECVPVPLNVFDQLPAYFRESILASETEWSQHKKLIDFSKRPGGFRRAMVQNLPYFMVQWDYKGEKGYGHVIEGVEDSAAAADEAEGQVDEGDRGGGEFPRWFAAEIIGNLLDVEPRKWRRPRRIDLRLNEERVGRFRRNYSKYDWTGLIGR